MIRRFNKRDAKEVSDLIRKALVDVNSIDYPKSVIQYLWKDYSPEGLSENSDEYEIYIETDGIKILGTVSTKNNHIFNVFIKPEFHKKGIGTKLMDYIEDIVKTKKYTYAELSSSITAYQFYKRRGYREIEIRFDENIGAIIIMQKVFSNSKCWKRQNMHDQKV